MSLLSSEERLRRKNEFDGNLVYGVREFNRLTGRDQHLKNRKTEVEQSDFVDPTTGLLKKDLTRFRPCPLCNEDHASLLFIKEGFRHLECRCDMVYVNPVLKEERLHSTYKDETSYTNVLLNEVQMEMDKRKSNYALDSIEFFLPQRGRLLDVGCGPGTFLEVARERMWDVFGLEFNSWCVSRLKELNIPVLSTPLEKSMIPDTSINCITLWGVLEHIFDPFYFLRLVNSKLLPGGILLLMLPNFNSLAVRILHEECVTFAGNFHINHFTDKTLGRLLARSGFDMMQCETLLTESGTINNYLDFQDPYFGDAKQLLDFLTPQFIHDNMLGYTLFVLARKQTLSS